MDFTPPNKELIAKYNKAESSGAPMDELKKIQLEKSASYGVSLDQKIYRLVNIDHFLADLRNNTFTFAQISKNTWGDKSSENPLENKKYILDKKTKVTINTKDYFGSCWSSNEDPKFSFREFGSNFEAIRIESIVYNILSELMNVNDKYYTLHYHIGPIIYKPKKEIEAKFQNQSLFTFLDSEGRALVETLLQLPDHFKEEKEIRFIYLYQSSDDNEWVRNNIAIKKIQLNKSLCVHPFNWKGKVSKITFDSRICPKKIESAKKVFESIGTNAFDNYYSDEHISL